MKKYFYYCSALTFIIFVIVTVVIINLKTEVSWELIAKNDTFYLTNSKYEIEVFSSGGAPEFIEQHKLEKYPGIILLIYHSGVAGTFNSITIHRAVIFDKKTGTGIGDYPYKYFTNGKLLPDGPEWTFGVDNILIKDPCSSLDTEVSLRY